MTAHPQITRGLAVCVATLVALVGLAVPSSAAAPCSRGVVALTFDDGPDRLHTSRVLDILRSRGATATFFQVGTRVAASPWLTRRAHSEGHLVANHSWDHRDFTTLSSTAVRDSIQRTNAAIRSAGVPTPTLVRPPYGATNDRVRSVIRGAGMTQVLWTLDPSDWRPGSTATTIKNRVLDGLRDRSIVLLHDGVGNSPAMVAALPGIIDGAYARGFCFGRLDAAGRVQPSVATASISGASAREGDRAVARVRVTLSRPPSTAVSVTYSTRNGTAKAGADYRATSGTITFPRGTTSATIDVPVIDDRWDERREGFVVRLTGSVGVTVGSGTGRVTIVDNDRPPTLSVESVRHTEPSAGVRRVNVPVRMSQASGKTVRVAYTVRPGNDSTAATAGRDFEPTRGTLTFRPGQTTRSVKVALLSDRTDEPDESIRVLLRKPRSATCAACAATLTVIDATR